MEIARRNFFTIKGPVRPELFFDRSEILEFFTRAMELESFDVLIALIAPFKFGKTSALLKLHGIAKKYDRVIPILLRLNLVSMPMHVMIRGLSRALNVDFTKYMRDVKKGRMDMYEVFQRINDELERRDLWVILFIDEFQDLARLVKAEGFFERLDDKFVFNFIRGVVEEFRFGLVVAGSLIGELMDAIKVWRGRFVEFKPREFPREDSIRMLVELSRLSGMQISEDLAEYIAVIMNDHPFHMQLFGYYLVDEGKTDEETIEKVRRKVRDFLVGYYDAKMLEVMRMSPRAMEILERATSGLRTSELSRDDIETVVELERAGYLVKMNDIYEFYDPMFKRYFIHYISGRPREKYLPEYTSEYLVARKLAYEEGFKSVFISLMSWGPFDILLLRPIGKYRGVGIQVKRAYGEFKINPRIEEDLKSASIKLNVIRIIAVVKMPERKIEYYSIEPRARAEKLEKLLRVLHTG